MIQISKMIGVFMKIIGPMTFTTDGQVKREMPVDASSFVSSGLTPTSSSKMTRTNSQIVVYQVVNQVIASAFGVPNHLPISLGSRSKYGMMAIRARAADGMITPARAGCMCSSSSCRFRKYHGALDGFGV